MSETVGLPWCREENYAAYAAIFEDRDNVAPTWEDFRQRAQSTEEHFRSEGRIVHWIDIDPETFISWCAAHQKRVNTRVQHDFIFQIMDARRHAGAGD